jgi:hypothetical protein
MTQEMLDRVNSGLKEEDRVEFEENDEAFLQKVKEKIKDA